MAPNKGSGTIKIQLIANILTIMVAVAAIGLSIWEGRENRLHNRLSVMPHLEKVQSTTTQGPLDSTATIRYALYNSGLGPAVLHDALVFFEDSLIFRSGADEHYYDFKDFMENLQNLNGSESIYSYTHSRRSGELMQAGKEHLFFNLTVPSDVEGINGSTTGYVRKEVLSRYSFAFCYCSVYGDRCNMVYLSEPPPGSFSCEF